MAHYVLLGNFTDQGIRAVKDTAKRARAFREAAGAMNVRLKEVYWTLGHYDIVITMEAPNDEIVESLMMKVGSLGNMKTQTLRAFGESEIEAILSKV